VESLKGSDDSISVVLVHMAAYMSAAGRRAAVWTLADIQEITAAAYQGLCRRSSTHRRAARRGSVKRTGHTLTC
jgi:hypothetical protein